MTMGDKIYNVIWYLLMLWSCWVPAGYGPYVLLGFNGGNFFITLWCGISYGYLREEGDFDWSCFLTSFLAFALMGGFYIGDVSFQPGSDAYSYALYFIFAAFWLSFGFRFLQYGLVRLLKNRS